MSLRLTLKALRSLPSTWENGGRTDCSRRANSENSQSVPRTEQKVPSNAGEAPSSVGEAPDARGCDKGSRCDVGVPARMRACASDRDSRRCGRDRRRGYAAGDIALRSFATAGRWRQRPACAAGCASTRPLPYPRGVRRRRPAGVPASSRKPRARHRHPR